VEPGQRPVLFPQPADDSRKAVLRDKGGLYQVVALMPEDRSLN
jgi:hypothetical protein